jgi:DNA mismatch repair ATPase MutS
MQFYIQRRGQFLLELKQLTIRYNTVSILRLTVAVVFLILGYIALNNNMQTALIIAMVVCVAAFFVLMCIHTALSIKKGRAAALVKVNEDEIAYLSGTRIAFDNGAEFVDFKHPYSHDLDIFGNKSLFHNLNRTETYKGREKLSQLLLTLLSNSDILKNQAAVRELAAKPEWRQEVMALGKSNKDSAQVYNKLMTWFSSESKAISTVSKCIAVIAPVALLASASAYLLTGFDIFINAVGYIYVFNLLFMLGYAKRIKTEVTDTTEVYDIIHRYSLIIQQLEKEQFDSLKLRSLQKNLVANGKNASQHIKKLAMLFSQMDSVSNVLAAALLNGLCLYHFHIFNSLLNFKKQYSQNIPIWLDAIAEAEALSSLGNLYYNNPDFTFPELNPDYKISFKNLAHPLIKKEVRVGNDVNFSPQFTILTGSNMSGKSTFLRSIGINMVLAGIGAPVCASEAFVHPLPVLVSMRLSDSLSDSESYFFAEIKRLREVMDELINQRAFVLLDEILRGTNSDDKQTGTIKVVEKMTALGAIGAIATHDIEVCNMVNDYPDVLVNRCFEVQIVDNELYFDYQLRDGICKNKSATFIMQKMGVI